MNDFFRPDGAMLRKKFLEANYSQKTIARILGIAESTLYKKLEGKSNFTTEEILILYRLLNLDGVERYFFKGIERR